jgi:DNA-directed RNA polymerase specialized sigma24 family protein
VSTVTCGVGVEETSGSWPVLAEELNPGGKKMRLSDDAVAAELFAAHYGRLAGWCRRLLDDDQTASEVAMEAFTRLLGRLRKVDDPVGYLYVIAANLVRDHWRKTKREREGMRVLQHERPADHEVRRSGAAQPGGAAARETAHAGAALLLRRLPDRGHRPAHEPTDRHRQERPVPGQGSVRKALEGTR